MRLTDGLNAPLEGETVAWPTGSRVDRVRRCMAGTSAANLWLVDLEVHGWALVRMRDIGWVVDTHLTDEVAAVQGELV